MPNKRIFKNTLLLYFRQILIILASLYGLRLLIGTLGVQDYGVMSVVSGFVALASFLPAAMASASQRYISYALGKGDRAQIGKAVSVNWIIYLSIAAFALLALETIGFWYVSHELKLPDGASASALALYHLTAFNFVSSILVAPFWAIMIAHEDINLFASISILEALLKLAATLGVAHLSGNKLEIYGWLQLVAGATVTVIYGATCFRKYEYAGFRRERWDRSLFNEILSFTGWTLFGQLSTVVRNQAVTVLLNQSTNPAVVAARALAITVSTQVATFSVNFNTGLYPPIIKAYAAGEKQSMFSLVFSGSKLTFFLTWIFAFPLIREMNLIYLHWLETVPPDATHFTQLALVEALIMSLSYPIATAARAPGKMRIYELPLGALQLAILPLSALSLHLGYSAASVFWVAIAINAVMFCVRLHIVSHLIGMPQTEFARSVLAPALRVAGATVVLSSLGALAVPPDPWREVALLFIDFATAGGCIYFLGLDRTWRDKLRSNIRHKLLAARRFE